MVGNAQDEEIKAMKYRCTALYNEKHSQQLKENCTLLKLYFFSRVTNNRNVTSVHRTS
jgi:hypothetical protein